MLDSLIFAWYHFIVYENPEIEVELLKFDFQMATWHVFSAIAKKLWRFCFPNKELKNPIAERVRNKKSGKT